MYTNLLKIKNKWSITKLIGGWEARGKARGGEGGAKNRLLGNYPNFKPPPHINQFTLKLLEILVYWVRPSILFFTAPPPLLSIFHIQFKHFLTKLVYIYGSRSGKGAGRCGHMTNFILVKYEMHVQN